MGGLILEATICKYHGFDNGCSRGSKCNYLHIDTPLRCLYLCPYEMEGHICKRDTKVCNF